MELQQDIAILLNRLERIKYWATNYQPDSITKLKETKDTEFFNTLEEREQQDKIGRAHV